MFHKKTILSVVVILFLISAVLGARILKPHAAKRMEASAARETSTAPAAKHGPVQVVRFTLYDAGIYPRQARVGKGLVAITIEDLSGGTSGLVVDRLNGNAHERVGVVLRSERHWRGREEMQLQPGNYELYMSDRPGNRARLIVEP